MLFTYILPFNRNNKSLIYIWGKAKMKSKTKLANSKLARISNPGTSVSKTYSLTTAPQKKMVLFIYSYFINEETELS